jgi:hypothetical protein
MSMLDFVYLCYERTIDPDVAIEHPKVVDAIRSGDVNYLIAVLDNNF